MTKNCGNCNRWKTGVRRGFGQCRDKTGCRNRPVITRREEYCPDHEPIVLEAKKETSHGRNKAPQARP